MKKPPEPEFDAPTFRGEDWSLGAWLALIRDRYLTLDRRTLGFTRILLGSLLLTDVIHRRAAWDEMFSTIGVLPNHVGLRYPQALPAFSIFNAFSTPGELHVLFWILVTVALALLVGYRTRVAQILALVLFTGMNGRVLLAENGGYIVENLLLLWTAFLPMGDRFSIDALVASMKRRREANADELNDREGDDRDDPAHVSLAGLAIVLQLAAIYFFNVVHKTGNAWKNGTAVHYVLHVDRMATPIVAVVRDHVPPFAILFMTKTALAFEAGLPVALLAPIGRAWARRAAIFMINALHLAFGVTFVLGPFAWSCCVFSTLLFAREDWELAITTMRRPHRARVVLFDPRSGGALFVCRLLKRLDRFALLTFEAKDGVPLGVGVRREGGAIQGRADALADVVAALPLGPIGAWIPRLPLVRALFDASLAALEPLDISRFFGLRIDPSPPPSPPLAPAIRRAVAGTVREAMIAIMIVASMNQGAVELWAINRRVTLPHVEPLRTLTLKLRFLQGWFMFSPNPVMEDGTIVVDAITVDGRHVDPFTARAPDFDLSRARSLRLTQQWCDYFNRIQLPINAIYREAMRAYMIRLPARTGNPNDAIVSGEVYWVKDLNPRWNERAPWGYERVKVFSFDGEIAK